MTTLRLTADYRGVRGIESATGTRGGRLEHVSLSAGDVIDGDLADWATKNDLPVEEVKDEPKAAAKKAPVKKTAAKKATPAPVEE